MLHVLVDLTKDKSNENTDTDKVAYIFDIELEEFLKLYEVDDFIKSIMVLQDILGRTITITKDSVVDVFEV